jgi:hypothetical protein
VEEAARSSSSDSGPSPLSWGCENLGAYDPAELYRRMMGVTGPRGEVHVVGGGQTELVACCKERSSVAAALGPFSSSSRESSSVSSYNHSSQATVTSFPLTGTLLSSRNLSGSTSCSYCQK